MDRPYQPGTGSVTQVYRKDTVLLCSDGSLSSPAYTARLPRAVVEAWGPEASRALFTPEKRSVLATEVAPSARDRLHQWNLLSPPAFNNIFTRLEDETKPFPPRPERLEALAAFWAFANEHRSDRLDMLGWWRRAAIVPLAGRDRLGGANATLSSRSRPTECSPADWQFIIERAEVLDDDWRKLVDLIKENPSEAQRSLEKALDRRLKEKELVGIVDGFRKTKLDQSPTLDSVFEQVAPRMFSNGTPNTCDAVRFVQIASKLDVSLPVSSPVRFLCVDGQWRGRSHELLAQSDIDLQYLLPANWLRGRLISPQYEESLKPSEIAAWRKWSIQPQKGGLSSFALPVAARVAGVWNRDETFFKSRGGTLPGRRWSSQPWEYTDFDWNNEILDHWRQLELDHGDSVWTDIVFAVISAWSVNWEERMWHQVHQQRGGNRSRVDAKDTAANWVHKLRNRACVPDTYGVPRLPAELLRRTPETSALLDIEPFVLERWDVTEHQPALDVLGVRTQPTDAAKILDRLRALSHAENAPIGLVRDLYRAIERVLPRLPADRVKEVTAAFAAEKLIRTEGGWERSGFCFRENPASIPGVSVLHSEVRDVIGLWAKLEIKPQPRAEDALRWLGSLPIEVGLAEPDRKAAAAVLDLYPLDAWSVQKRWLSLQGRIAPTASFRWACLEPRAVTGLFANVRAETADFSMLGHARLLAVLPNAPRLLETSLERRVLGHVATAGSPEREDGWLQALGQVLAHLKDDSVDGQILEADRRAGQRLAGTRWIPATSVTVQPSLDGTTAGSQSPVSILWIRDLLYVDGDSVHAYKAVVEELQRPFQTLSARGIIRDCVGRQPEWIQQYAAAHLELAEGTDDARQAEASSPHGEPEQTKLASVFPKRVENHESNSAGLTAVESEAENDRGRDHSPPEEPTHQTLPPREKPASPREPSKSDRLASFLEGRGFHWDASNGRYVHPDGSFIQRSEGIFPWELISADVVTLLWLADTGLSADTGVQLPAEIWNAARRGHAVLLSPEGIGNREDHFSTLRAEVEAQKLELYPSVYTIRIPSDSGEGVFPIKNLTTSPQARPRAMEGSGGSGGSSS
jgi:hypothetical protein